VAGNTITVSTCDAGTSFDTYLSLLDGCPHLTTSPDGYELPVGVLGSNNDAEVCSSNSLASELAFDFDAYQPYASANGSYYVLLEPFGNLENGHNGTYALTLTCATPVPTPAPTSMPEVLDPTFGSIVSPSLLMPPFFSVRDFLK
jgi:hypothetical protein